MTNYVNVYNARPVKDKSKLKIKMLGSVKLDKETKLKDKMISRSMIADNVFCHFFIPTITYHYLCQSNKIPVIIGRVDYIKKLIRRPMMSIIYYFEVDKNEFKRRKKVSGGKPYPGKFGLELELNGETVSLNDEFKNELEVFESKDKCIKIMEDILRSDESLEVFKEFIEEINKRREEEAKDLNFPTEPPVVTIKADDYSDYDSNSNDSDKVLNESLNTKNI